MSRDGTNFETKIISDLEIFCEVSSRQARPYVPVELRPQVVTALHAMDHLGEKATLTRVSGEYYWPSLKKDVENYVKKCNICCKIKTGKKLVNTGQFQVPDRRFSHVMVDIVGPLPSSQGYKYLLAGQVASSKQCHSRSPQPPRQPRPSSITGWRCSGSPAR